VFAKVVSPRRVQRIPHRRGGIIEGMVVVHGEIFPTFAMHTLLDVPRTESGASRANALCRPRQAVIGTHGDRWVFFADEFAAVSDVRASAMTPAPVTLAKAAMNFAKGLVPIEGHTVAILDEELLLYRLKKECGA
jgi:chemotaxis signal transduction protein